MDKLDIALLRSLFLDVHSYPARSELHESLSELARKLHVSEPTVRSRITGYIESGFLKGWGVFVNPNIIGQRVRQTRLDVFPPSSKQDAIRKIKLIEGVWYIASYHVNALGVGLYYEDETALKSRLELMSRIANAEHVNHGEILFPQCSHRFTSRDLAIIRGIHSGPWQSFASVAEQAHLSSKTVRRRLNLMISERALFIAPILDFRSLRGVIPVDLYVFYSNQETARETEKKILSLVDDVLITAVPGGPDHSYLGLILDGVARSNDILGHVRQFAGVKEAYVDLIEDHLPQYQAFEAQIDKLSKVKEERPSALRKDGFRAAGVRSKVSVRLH